ncbi:MAG: VIT1/CCC1 family protein, partial [bacterium]
MTEDVFKQTILRFMQNEITEHHVYLRLAADCRGKNCEILAQIAADELRHYKQFRQIVGRDVAPGKLKIFFYILLSRVLGLTFAMKLMEAGEVMAEAAYEKLLGDMPDIARIIEEEARHEKMLLAGIEEESLGYLSSVVLAVNNALQEFTGIAVGLTFAIQNSRAVANT